MAKKLPHPEVFFSLTLKESLRPALMGRVEKITPSR
jgi:hypothetical protein